jgi:hypothetical protein
MWSDNDAFDGHDGYGRPGYEPSVEVASCPRCGSTHLAQRHLARRILGLVGTVAGATGSAVRAWHGAELGGTVGAAAGPPGFVLGAVAGAVLSALAGGSAGCAVGVRLGDAIDARLLNDLRCLECGHPFDSPRPAEA